MGYFTAKYVKTRSGRLIVFCPALKHSEFKHFDPVSAGFISFGVGKDGNPSCTCYGESDSLGLKSDEDDSRIAKIQILDNRC